VSALPVLTGLAATVVASVQLLAWLAMGALVLPRGDDGPRMSALALLFGTAATGFGLAVLAYAGWVTAALALLVAADVAALAAARRRLPRLLGGLRAEFACALEGRRWLRGVAAAMTALYWLNAIVPPRDGDVLRYHLAHARQILMEGRWEPVAEYVYALPFGWSINYLGFEALGIPEAASLVNLGAWLVTVAVMLAWLRADGRPHSSIALLVVVLTGLQPMVLKVVTTAHADSYCLLVTTVAVALVSSEPRRGFAGAAMLGFAAWVGAQSRYQLAAVGLAVSAVVLLQLFRRRAGTAEARGFAVGAAAALALASPFYLVNAAAFGNPVWPILAGKINGMDQYRDRVVQAYDRTVNGTHAPVEMARAFEALLADFTVFPIPLMLVFACGASLLVGDARLRRIAAVGALFMLLWVAMQPSLLPRYVLVIAPVAVLGTAAALARADGWALPRRVMRAAAGAALAGGGAVAVYYSGDGLRYLATADEEAYHQATWYYPVYRWISASTDADARFLAVVPYGPTYYLDRWYRKADPYLAGEVDWDAVRTPEELHRVLHANGYDYVLYERRDWSPRPGGRNLTAAMEGAVRRGLLRPVRTFQLDLVTNRTLGRTIPATVWVLQVVPGAPSTGTMAGPALPLAPART
jgi:hypothetical protein